MGGSGGIIGDLTGFNVEKKGAQKEQRRIKKENAAALSDVADQKQLEEDRADAVTERKQKRSKQRRAASTGRSSTLITDASTGSGGSGGGGKTLLGL